MRVIHMTLDMARLHGQAVDVLITDQAKYFAVIAQGVHPVVGNHIGLGTKDYLFAHTAVYKYTMPLGSLQSRMLEQLLGIPQGTIEGMSLGAMAAIPFIKYMGMAYGAYTVPQWLTL